MQVGVNKYRLEKEDSNFEVLKIDNNEVREGQIARINKMKAARDNNKVNQVLDQITESAKSGKGNLLELAVEAAKLRATVGEISYAIEKVVGRHVASDSIVRGAYSKESVENTNDSGKKEYEDALA